MSRHYYDERIERGDRADTDERTVTSGYRSLFGGLAVTGLVLCATPAIVLGMGMVIAFGILWICTPVVEQAEQECIEETRNDGDGAGSFWRTVGIMLLIGFLAILLGGGAMLAMLNGW